MPIVNSHYVTINEPYPIIYYDGTVAMQIGTLIVVYGPGAEYSITDNRESTRMHTRSHPVVAYGNKYASEPRNEWKLNMWSEGVVWDFVTLKDVFTLCFTKQKEINFEAIDVLTETIRMKEAINGTYKFRLSSVLKDLESMGIKRPALLSKLGPTGYPAHVYVIRQLAKAIVCVRCFGALFCCVRLGRNVEVMATEIRRQVADYMMLLESKEIKLTYETEDDVVDKLVETLNK